MFHDGRKTIGERAIGSCRCRDPVAHHSRWERGASPTQRARGRDVGCDFTHLPQESSSLAHVAANLVKWSVDTGVHIGCMKKGRMVAGVVDGAPYDVRRPLVEDSVFDRELTLYGGVSY